MPDLSPANQRKFISIVDRIIAKKHENFNSDTTALEQETDAMVYAFYSLTPAEIKLVEAAR